MSRVLGGKSHVPFTPPSSTPRIDFVSAVRKRWCEIRDTEDKTMTRLVASSASQPAIPVILSFGQLDGGSVTRGRYHCISVRGTWW